VNDDTITYTLIHRYASIQTKIYTQVHTHTHTHTNKTKQNKLVALQEEVSADEAVGRKTKGMAENPHAGWTNSRPE
jgi:hypothetical protein